MKTLDLNPKRFGEKCSENMRSFTLIAIGMDPGNMEDQITFVKESNEACVSITLSPKWRLLDYDISAFSMGLGMGTGTGTDTVCSFLMFTDRSGAAFPNLSIARSSFKVFCLILEARLFWGHLQHSRGEQKRKVSDLFRPECLLGQGSSVALHFLGHFRDLMSVRKCNKTNPFPQTTRAKHSISGANTLV